LIVVSIQQTDRLNSRKIVDLFHNHVEQKVDQCLVSIQTARK